MEEVVFRDVLNLVNQRGQRGPKLRQRRILFRSRRRSDKRAQFSYSLLQRGRHNTSSDSLECQKLRCRGVQR
jgi:hypothetical protein